MNGYGPDVIIPTPAEADEMEHDNSVCTFNKPCEACKRQMKRTH